MREKNSRCVCFIFRLSKAESEILYYSVSVHSSVVRVQCELIVPLDRARQRVCCSFWSRNDESKPRVARQKFEVYFLCIRVYDAAYLLIVLIS